MQPRPMCALALALAVVTTIAPAARATDPAEDEDLDATAGRARAAGADARTRELTLHFGGGFTAPAGSLAEGLGSGDRVSIGPSIAGSAEVGLSRYAGLQASAGYAFLSGPYDGCKGCGGTSFDLGVSLVYHLTQGIAIDPWISFGAGYRSFVIDAPEEEYVGIDVAKMALGADFRPVRSLGLGPTLELDLGTTLDRPAGQNGSVHAMFLVGVRLSLDPLDAIGVGSPPTPPRGEKADRPDRTTLSWALLPLSL